jgi:hypothetical protein
MADRLTPLVCVECGRQHADNERGAPTAPPGSLIPTI